jgi:hypothetical protein
LTKYTPDKNLYNFAKDQGVDFHIVYEGCQDLALNKWVILVKDRKEVKLIVKDEVILANNLIKILNIMYDKGVLEASKHINQLDKDFKEVLKDYETETKG